MGEQLSTCHYPLVPIHLSLRYLLLVATLSLQFYLDSGLASHILASLVAFRLFTCVSNRSLLLAHDPLALFFAVFPGVAPWSKVLLWLKVILRLESFFTSVGALLVV